jgi:hypothetical protein
MPYDRVTEYRSGLDLQINVMITMSGTAPDLTNYDGWCVCAFRQYKMFGRTRTGNPLACLPAALPRPRMAGVFPTPAPTHIPVSFVQAPVPVLPAVIPIDVDQTRAHPFPCTCFRCGAVGHLTRECSVMSNIWHTDFLTRLFVIMNHLGSTFSRDMSI